MTGRQVLAGTAAELVLVLLTVRVWWAAAEERRAVLAREGWSAPGRRPRRGAALDRWLRSTGPGARLGARVDAAGLPVGLPGVLAAALALAGVTRVLGAAALTGVLGTLAAVASVPAAYAVLGRLSARRRERLVDQLPEAATALANGVAAGLALPAALRMSAADVGEPAAGELRRIVDRLDVGHPLPAAFAAAAARWRSADLDLLVTTVTVQHRGGGDLAGMLRRLAGTLEQRRDSQREVRSLTGGSTSTAYLIVAFAVGTLAVYEQADDGILDRTFSRPAGLLALLAAAAMMALGLWLVGRVARSVR